MHRRGVRCLNRETAWTENLKQRLLFTETDKPSTDKFPWSDSPSFVVHFWFDFTPGKKVFIIIMCSFLLSFCFFQFVLLVSSLLYVSCTETKGRHLLDNRGIFFGLRTFCLWHTVYTGGEFAGVTNLSFKNAYITSCHQPSMWHLPLIT